MSRDAGMEEYAAFKSDAAEVGKVKTGVDSGFKQVQAGVAHPVLLNGIFKALKRRYVAGNGAYICLHDYTDRLPQMITGSALKSAAGKTQCVRKSRPGAD